MLLQGLTKIRFFSKTAIRYRTIDHVYRSLRQWFGWFAVSRGAESSLHLRCCSPLDCCYHRHLRLHLRLYGGF